MDVRVLEKDFHDGVVVNGPDFEVRWDVRGIAGFDEVDFVRSIFMIAAGARVGEVLIWHFGLSDLTLAYRYKLRSGFLA